MLKLDSCSNIGRILAKEVLKKHYGKSIKEIISSFDINIVYEKPLNCRFLKRISEYRPKKSQICIFHKEKELPALAHELFHFLERKNGIKLSKNESEKQAKNFVKALIQC